MTSLPDPSTDYTGMQPCGVSVASASLGAGAGGVRSVEMAVTSSSAASKDTNNPDPEHATVSHGHFHVNYETMASELPPVDDRFENEGNAGRDDQDGDGGDGDDVQSMASSMASSVLTADGIHDLAGFYVVCLVILVGDMSRGVFFPSMWPLVDELGGTSVTLGYSVAAFSLGRILVSPLFGGWSVTYGYTKTLTFSCSILLLGTLLYAQIQNVGKTGFLIFSQCILGLGSGTLGVTRAFIADITAQRNRTTYMAWITAVQYAGFTVTPFVGAVFNRTLQNVDIQWG